MEGTPDELPVENSMIEPPPNLVKRGPDGAWANILKAQNYLGQDRQSMNELRSNWNIRHPKGINFYSFYMLRQKPEWQGGAAYDKGSAQADGLCPRALDKGGNMMNYNKCMVCEAEYNWKIHKHHCRRCGISVCGNCSGNKATLTASLSNDKPHAYELHPMKKVRVCNLCHEVETKKLDMRSQLPGSRGAEMMEAENLLYGENPSYQSIIQSDGIKVKWFAVELLGGGGGAAARVAPPETVAEATMDGGGKKHKYRRRTSKSKTSKRKKSKRRKTSNYKKNFKKKTRNKMKSKRR